MNGYMTAHDVGLGANLIDKAKDLVAKLDIEKYAGILNSTSLTPSGQAMTTPPVATEPETPWGTYALYAGAALLLWKILK